MSKHAALLSACFALLAAACTPELNWRDIHAGAGEQAGEVSLQFPCKVSRAQRKLTLSDNQADAPVNFTLTGCHAADMSFALGAADIGNAAATAQTLDWMRKRLAQNIKAQPPLQTADTGNTSPSNSAYHARKQVITLQGKLPDGTTTEQRAVLFAQGSRVYQAIVMAPQGKLRAEAAENFFNSIALQD